ncbi:MAG: RNA methyltransferase [Bacilli bacterium]
MEITSLQNNKVKYWVSLSNKKVRDKEKVFLIEGNHLVSEAIKSGLIVEVISTVDKNADFYVTKDIMKKISNQKSISEVAAVVKFFKEEKVDGNILIIDALQDPGNLGTIIRSAVAFNFKNIVLSSDSVDQYNDKVIRASEGMIFNVNIVRRNLISYLPKLKKDGIKIVGTDVVNGVSIKNVRSKNIALVIGNEGVGMSEYVKNECNVLVNIPINNECESLNASVAASILMYEVSNG